MKTKIISLALVIALTFSFASCGKTNELATTTAPNVVYDPDSITTTNPSDDETITTKGTDIAENNSVSVTIPEGYTLLKLSWLLEEKGVCPADAFVNASQNYDINSNPVLADLGKAQNVCFRLEGYMFPATYSFKKGSDPKLVIDKLVSTFAAKFNETLRQRAKEMGKTVHEILTVASIIEKEAFTEEQRNLISSTLYNRLSQKMQLQCDVTVKYCTGVIQEKYPNKIEQYKFNYNTYRCAGLPAGPICNPGMASINAALYPADTNYLYFVIDTKPPYTHAFAATYEEHQANCKKMGY
ncbi:MAG: endolytic transglycosylase MltG [Oscillospiraceae bacterium]